MIRCLDKFENISDGETQVMYVPMTKMYWVTGRNNKLVAFDPRAPSNITKFIQDANHMQNMNVTMLFNPPSTDLVLAATKEKKILVWRYNHCGAYRQATLCCISR